MGIIGGISHLITPIISNLSYKRGKSTEEFLNSTQFITEQVKSVKSSYDRIVLFNTASGVKYISF